MLPNTYKKTRRSCFQQVTEVITQMEVTFSPLKRSLTTPQKGHSEEPGRFFFFDRGLHHDERFLYWKQSFHSNRQKPTNSHPAQCNEKFRGQFGEFLM